MTAYSTDTADLLFVGVPEDAENITLLADVICFNSEIQDPYCTGGDIIKVSPGYSLLSARTADGITEIEAGKVVGKYCKMYRDYESKYNGLAAHSLNAVQSLLSLLRSLNLNPSETVVLFKIKN